MNVETKQVKLSELKLNPNNPRRIGRGRRYKMKMKKRVAEYRAWRAEHEYDQDFSECPKVVYSDLSPCPKCGKTEDIFMCDPLINSVYANFFLSCGNCGYEGPLGEIERDAFAAWGVIFDSEKDEEGLNSKYA